MVERGILWRDSAAEVFSAPMLNCAVSADLVILGGGFSGCSAALAAAGQGADVVLLEAAQIGDGGSGRNVGLVNAGLWLSPDKVCTHLGQVGGERLNTLLGAAPSHVFDLIQRYDIACEATRAGTLHLAHSPKGLTTLKERHAQMIVRGAPVTILNADEARNRTGTQAFYGALHDPRAGTIQPLSYVRGLARAARDAGALIYEQSAATSVHYEKDQWHVETEKGTVRAKALLIATNAYHQPVQGQGLPAVPIVQYFQIATTPLTDAAEILPDGEGCWDCAPIMTSFRRDQAGRVIIGGLGGPSEIHTDWAKRKLKALFPSLKTAPISHAWSGRISMKSDHLPCILRLGPNAFSVFGYSGRGIAPGTAFGHALGKALISQDEQDLPVTPISSYKEALVRAKTGFYETAIRASHLVMTRL